MSVTLMPVHLSMLHIKCNEEQRKKVERKGGGSKVGTLETLKRLRMKLSGHYPPENSL